MNKTKLNYNPQLFSSGLLGGRFAQSGPMEDSLKLRAGKQPCLDCGAYLAQDTQAEGGLQCSPCQRKGPYS